MYANSRELSFILVLVTGLITQLECVWPVLFCFCIKIVLCLEKEAKKTMLVVMILESNVYLNTKKIHFLFPLL